MSLFRKLLNFYIRREACKLTAATTLLDSEKPCMPMVWSMTAFYEQYMLTDSEGTHEDFGPKDPVNLAVVAKEVNE